METDSVRIPRVFPALGSLYDRLSPYSYTLMRFVTGACLVPHGFQKLFMGGLPFAGVKALGLPAAMAYLVGFNEFFCGLMIALGLFTRFGAAGFIIEFAVVSFAIQIKYGYFWTSKGLEFPLVIWLFAIAIFFRGGGRYSLDRVIGREL